VARLVPFRGVQGKKGERAVVQVIDLSGGREGRMVGGEREHTPELLAESRLRLAGKREEESANSFKPVLLSYSRKKRTTAGGKKRNGLHAILSFIRSGKKKKRRGESVFITAVTDVLRT